MFNQNEMEVVVDPEPPVLADEMSPEPSKITVQCPNIDIDALCSYFKTEALLPRLLYIAEVCPSLRVDALNALVDNIKYNGENVLGYQHVYQKIEGYRNSNSLTNKDAIPKIDSAWIEANSTRMNNRLDQLQAEFRHQKDDGVKESIRRAMDDLFRHFVAMGNNIEALKIFSRGIRDYCIAPNHLIQMLLNWINASVYAEQWGKVYVLVPQVDRAITEANERDSTPSAPNKPPATKIQKELINTSKAKLTAAQGLAFIKQSLFKSAADKFMQVEIEHFDYPELLSNKDIALYGTICALATFSRNELKERVLLSSKFRKFLESEPKLVELIQRFCGNKFGSALDVLAEIKDQLLLNVYLAPHIPDLYADIRKRAVTQYFEPYLTADLNEMATEFRTSVQDLERELVDLIRHKHLDARIDLLNKVLQNTYADKQKQVLARTLKVNKDLESSIKAIVIRAFLQQKNVFIGDNPKRRRDAYEELQQMHADPTHPSAGRSFMSNVQRMFSRFHPEAQQGNTMEDFDDEDDEY